MNEPLFRGCCCALATPFDPLGEVDYGALGRMIDFQLDNGTAALAVCATTGEGATLSEREFEGVVSFAAQRVCGRVPVIAGAGKNCTRTTLRLSRLARKNGADGLLLVTPYYNKSSQAGLAEHFERVADGVEIPIIIYNVPGRTGMTVAPETYGRLSTHPNIRGVKEASGDISLIARAVKACGGRLDYYSGNDEQTLAVLALGGKGVISTTANIAPAQMAEICTRWEKGDIEGARRAQLDLLELIDAMFIETNPIPLKYALGKMGLCGDKVRLPLVAPSEGSKKRIGGALEKFGLI